MKKLELIDRVTGLGTAVVSYDVKDEETKARSKAGAQPASPSGGAQPAGEGQTGGQADAAGSGSPSGGLPPIIFDPGRGMGPAFRAPKRFVDWGELAAEIGNIAEQARGHKNRAVVHVNSNPSPHQLHDVVARMPNDSEVLVVIG